MSDGRVRLLLADLGEYSIDARAGAFRNRVDFRCEPAKLNVPEHGGTFTIQLRRDD